MHLRASACRHQGRPLRPALCPAKAGEVELLARCHKPARPSEVLREVQWSTGRRLSTAAGPAAQAAGRCPSSSSSSSSSTSSRSSLLPPGCQVQQPADCPVAVAATRCTAALQGVELEGFIALRPMRLRHLSSSSSSSSSNRIRRSYQAATAGKAALRLQGQGVACLASRSGPLRRNTQALAAAAVG